MLPKSIELKNKQVFLIDQREIPERLISIEIKTMEEMYDAIKTMVVRGAPAIGISAAAGLALFIETMDSKDFQQKIINAGSYLVKARPTAVNLFWAINKIKEYAAGFTHLTELKKNIWLYVQQLADEDEQINRLIGKNGADLFSNDKQLKGKQLKVITHCNAGSLATVYWGTALGVIRDLHNRDQIEMVYADETRPRLQGGKITSFELMKDNIPVTVITDNMAAHMMKLGEIDFAVVGADRIAANGDAANKIGTYGLAIAAFYHKIPFYVAAPLSTIDSSIKSGDGIEIEDRDHNEVTHINNIPIMPEGVNTINPAFDVTPAELITGIITEKGVLTGDLKKEISELLF